MRKKLLIILSFLCVVSSVSFVFADETESKEVEAEKIKKEPRFGFGPILQLGSAQKSPNVFQAVVGEGEIEEPCSLESFNQSKNSSKNVFQANAGGDTQTPNSKALKPDENSNVRSTRDFKEMTDARFGYQMEELQLRNQILVEQRKNELAPFRDSYYKRLNELSLAISKKSVELDKLKIDEGIYYNPLLGETEEDMPAGSKKVEEIHYQLGALFEEREKVVDQYEPVIAPICKKYSKLFIEIGNEEYEIFQQRRTFVRKLERGQRKMNKRVRKESDGNGCQSTSSPSGREGISTGDQEKIEALDKEIAKIGTILEKNKDKDPKNDVEPQMMARLITEYLGLKKIRANLSEAKKGNADKGRKRDGLEIKVINEELKIIEQILEKNKNENRDNDLHPKTAARLKKRLEDLLQIKIKNDARTVFQTREITLSSLTKMGH